MCTLRVVVGVGGILLCGWYFVVGVCCGRCFFLCVCGWVGGFFVVFGGGHFLVVLLSTNNKNSNNKVSSTNSFP